MNLEWRNEEFRIITPSMNRGAWNNERTVFSPRINPLFSGQIVRT
ncbi:MAG: hypothetical protein AAF915_02185 [Cyanobacteria bacterium P01_D01_bin.50]